VNNFTDCVSNDRTTSVPSCGGPAGDERRAELIEHEIVALVGQRVFGIALGYEDLNDHVPFSTKTVSQNKPLETAASKPVEPPKSVSGDWLPTPEIARNRANSWVSQDSKWETGLGG
jgi:hypothetical protein